MTKFLVADEVQIHSVEGYCSFFFLLFGPLLPVQPICRPLLSPNPTRSFFAMVQQIKLLLRGEHEPRWCGGITGPWHEWTEHSGGPGGRKFIAKDPRVFGPFMTGTCRQVLLRPS